MHHKTQGPVTAFTATRRQFTGLLCGSGLLTLTGCGGGGSAASTPSATPQITLAPQSASVAAGQAITLRVEASGSNLAYQWRRNGVALNGATSSSLQLTVTSTDDGARYTVLVSNSNGQAESTAAVLTVSPSGTISLLAGGLGGRSLLAGNGTQARLSVPVRVTVNKAGEMYMACWTVCGKVSAQGDVSFLGNFLGGYIPNDLACDSKGDLYASGLGHPIYKLVNGVFSPFVGQSGSGFLDGVGQSAQLNGPAALAFDTQDNLYIIDAGNHAIRKVSPAGVVSTLAGSPSNVTLTDGKGSAAGFANPSKLLVLNDGSLLVLDGASWRKILSDGSVSTLAGTVPAITAVTGVDTNALYALLGNSVVKLALDGSTVNLASSQSEYGYSDLAMASDGKLAVADGSNHMIHRIDPTTGQVSAWVGAAPKPGHVDGEGALARFADMGPSCVDQNGNVYVIDTLAKTLRKVTPSGSASTLFTDFPSDGGVAVDTSGHFYGVRNRAIIKVAPSGVQQVWAGQTGVLGYADGAGATASFARPMGLVFDAQGNLLVGDSPDQKTDGLSVYYTYTYGSTIRKITPAGVVSTVAGITGRVFSDSDLSSSTTPFPNRDVTFIRPAALAMDPDGRLWVLDQAGVRRIDAQGSTPVWLSREGGSSMAYAVGSSGAVYVARQNVISKLSADGTQTVLAGVNAPYHEGVQLGPLPGALAQVTSIACGAANVLYVGAENAVLRIQLN